MSDDTDNTDAADSTDTIEKRVIVTIEDCPLPPTEAAREEVLAELEDAIGGLLSEYRDAATITTKTGHHYAEITDECPRCGGTLELREYTYCDNGAVAEANCGHTPDCDWRGRAIYRLIDLESGPITDVESAVASGDMIPSYYPYRLSNYDHQ